MTMGIFLGKVQVCDFWSFQPMSLVITAGLLKQVIKQLTGRQGKSLTDLCTYICYELLFLDL